MPQILVSKVIDRCVKSLHNFSILRLLAKRLFRGVSIRQPFYSGVILLDAVDHSWAWTGKTRYQTHDLELQNKLLSLSFSCHIFIDIGSNIGAMTFSILLRNPQIRAICIDPNARAIQLCQESSRINQLDRRISCLHLAVSDKDGTVPFDDRGSVIGHVGESKKKYTLFRSLISLIDIRQMNHVL